MISITGSPLTLATCSNAFLLETMMPSYGAITSIVTSLIFLVLP